MTRFPRVISCIAAIVIVTASGLAEAKPGRGGGPGGGGPPHGGGGAPHGGGAPRAIHMGAPHGGPRLAIPHAAPRAAAIRAFRGPRIHAAPRIRAARPAFHGRTAVTRHAARAFRARAVNRAAFSRTSVNRSPGNIARGSAASNRSAAQALRSTPVHARGDARNTSAFALRTFSGSSAQAAAARVFRDPALWARSRFDPAFARVRFAGAFWPGPFFWPYAYYDDAFWLWPSAYDDVFWTYGYDDILLGIYRPYAFSDYGDFIDAIGRPVRRARGHQAPPSSFAELCGAAAPGLTEWPVDEIAAAIQPTPQQRTLLDDLIKASDKAAETLRAACPRNVAVTPIGRLEVLQQQLAALEDAIRIVRPKLEKFYVSLSDDQKERFNELAPRSAPNRRVRAAAPQADRLARACESRAANPDWPIGRIEQTVRPDERQRSALNELRAATEEAARLLRSACPTDLPLTPTGRLAAMEQRIDAMLQAIATLRPALSKFYAALNDEQKARFNRALVSADRRTG